MRLDVRRIPGRVRIEATSAPAAEQHNNRSQRALSDVDAGGNRCMREPTKFRCKVVRVEAAATNDLDAAIQSATDSNCHAVRRRQTEGFSRLKYAALRCGDFLATMKRAEKF